MGIYENIKSFDIKSFAKDFLLVYILFFLFHFLIDVQTENLMAWYYDDQSLKSSSVIPFIKKDLFKASWIALICICVAHFCYKTSFFPKKIK